MLSVTWHTIKSGTLQPGTTENGIPAEQQNTKKQQNMEHPQNNNRTLWNSGETMEQPRKINQTIYIFMEKSWTVQNIQNYI